MEDEENIPILRHTIGSYGTTGARLKLCSYVDALNERAIYCDTDFVFYIQQCGECLALKYGGRLGDMTNDLGPDNYVL